MYINIGQFRQFEIKSCELKKKLVVEAVKYVFIVRNLHWYFFFFFGITKTNSCKSIFYTPKNFNF